MANLKDAYLYMANFTGANLEGAKFSKDIDKVIGIEVEND